MICKIEKVRREFVKYMNKLNEDFPPKDGYCYGIGRDNRVHEYIDEDEGYIGEHL